MQNNLIRVINTEFNTPNIRDINVNNNTSGYLKQRIQSPNTANDVELVPILQRCVRTSLTCNPIRLPDPEIFEIYKNRSHCLFKNTSS